MTKPATTKQVQAINAILAARKLMEQKAVIILDASQGRTEHSSQLSYYEAYDLLKALSSQESGVGSQEGKQKMIKSIIAMAHEMGWIEQRTEVRSMKSETIAEVLEPVPTKLCIIETKKDYSRLHEWIENNVFKKKLDDHTYLELTKLVSVFKNVYSGWLKNKTVK